MKEKSFTWLIDGFQWMKLYHYLHYIEFKALNRRFRIGWFERIMNDPRGKVLYIRNSRIMFYITICHVSFGWIKL